SSLARATLGERSSVDWEGLVKDYDRIRDLISRVIPGFDDYNNRIRQSGGFYLPNGPRERKFNTSSGTAHFTIHPITDNKLEPGQSIMMTMRSHDQFNTTIYGLDERYRGIYNGRRVIFLHPEDIKDEGLDQGQLVDLISHFEGEERMANRFVVVPFSIP